MISFLKKLLTIHFLFIIILDTLCFDSTNEENNNINLLLEALQLDSPKLLRKNGEKEKEYDKAELLVLESNNKSEEELPPKLTPLKPQDSFKEMSEFFLSSMKKNKKTRNKDRIKRNEDLIENEDLISNKDLLIKSKEPKKIKLIKKSNIIKTKSTKKE